MARNRRSGWSDYADLLSMVLDSPDTTLGLAKRFGMATNNMRRVLRELHALGLICVAAAHLPETVRGNGKPQAVWSMAGPPLADWQSLIPIDRVRPAVRSFGIVVLALMTSGASAIDLADEHQLGARAARALMRRLTTLRLAYIAEWRPTHGGPPVPIYRWGLRRRNAHRPAGRPASESWRRQHQIRQQRLAWVHMTFLTAGVTPA